MEKIINEPGGGGINARHFLEIGQGGLRDRLGRAESVQQSALARGANSGDFVEGALGELLLAPRPVGSNRETMRLVAQALHEIERRVARGKLERLLASDKKCFAPSIAVGALGDRRDRNVGDAELGENRARGIELSLTPVDQDEIRPLRKSTLAVGFLAFRRGRDIQIDLAPDLTRMKAAAGSGYATATDLADWLVKTLALPFREAHHVTGRLVATAAARNIPLEQLTLTEMQAEEPRISADVFAVLGVENSVRSRTSYGGTAPANVTAQAELWLARLANETPR